MTKHQDAFTDEMKHTNQDGVVEFDSFNSESTQDYVLSHPSGDRRNIKLEMPLLVAMARETRFEPDCEQEDEERCKNAMFDENLCRVAELALRTAGFDYGDIGLHKLRALMICVTRNLNFVELQNHISTYSIEELDQFGLQTAYDESTYRKTARELEETDQFSLLVDASYIATHALFRNGLPLPNVVKDKYELSYSVGPAASDFSSKTRQLALYELVDDLLEIVVTLLDLQRGPNASRELRSLLGVFAHAAHGGDSIERFEQTAQHVFQLDSAFSGPVIRGHIDELDLWEIQSMFDDIYQSLFEYALESGVIAEPVTIAYDLTDIRRFGTGPFDGDFTTEDGRWRFASLSFVDADFEFSFGLRLLKSESQRAVVLRDFLRELTSRVAVKMFFADRGFDAVADIEACRAYVPKRWAIHAQDHSDSGDPRDDYVKLRNNIELGGTEVIANAGFADLHPPTQLLGHYAKTDDPKLNDKIRAFWSDIQLPSDEKKREKRIKDLNFQYNQRARIETQFRLCKNRLDVSTDSRNPKHKLFYFHISTLFYNLYKIVNTVPSPKRGVEFDLTQNELLQVIQVVAFDGPVRSDALQYLQGES